MRALYLIYWDKNKEKCPINLPVKLKKKPKKK